MAASKIRIKKNCEWCGQEFYAQKITTRFCCKMCSEKSYKTGLRTAQIEQATNMQESRPQEEVCKMEYLSVRKAAVLLGLALRTTYDLIYCGKLVESGYLKITCFTTKSPCRFVPVFSTNRSQYIINLNQAVMSYSNTCPKVTLRQRPGANGRISLYLDYYPAIRNPKTMKMTRREFLGIYIFDNPTDPAFKEFNEVMLQKAETIRCQRQISLLNEEFNLPDNTKRNADALKYFNDYSRYKGDKYIFVCAHFSKFVNGKCTFNDITVELCNKFREYLLGARQLKHTSQKLSRNAAAAYWRNFRAMLNRAII